MGALRLETVCIARNSVGLNRIVALKRPCSSRVFDRDRTHYKFNKDICKNDGHYDRRRFITVKYVI